jgi:hypothetical protein
LESETGPSIIGIVLNFLRDPQLSLRQLSSNSPQSLCQRLEGTRRGIVHLGSVNFRTPGKTYVAAKIEPLINVQQCLNGIPEDEIVGQGPDGPIMCFILIILWAGPHSVHCVFHRNLAQLTLHAIPAHIMILTGDFEHSLEMLVATAMAEIQLASSRAEFDLIEHSSVTNQAIGGPGGTFLITVVNHVSRRQLVIAMFSVCYER